LSLLHLGELLADEARGTASSLRASRATRDDASVRPGSLPWRKAWNERGHQLAPGEVAGAAEEDEVEGHPGWTAEDETRLHLNDA
jgi:hypothetical protein